MQAQHELLDDLIVRRWVMLI